MPARSVACDECKRRKVRCSADPICANCIRDRKTCIYSSAPHRVAALQNTVSRYESLLKSIDRAWSKHVPHLTLSQALAGETAEVDHSRQQSQTTKPANNQQQRNAGSTPLPTSSPSVEAGTPEQSNAEDYEFDESQDLGTAIDGMGFLTTSTRKAGYTGPQSSIAALDLLRSLPQPTEDNDEVPVRAKDPSLLFSTQASTEIYIAQYFTHYHPYCPLLHEGLFRARLSGAVAKPRDGSWSLLLNMVIAMGAFAGDPSDNDIDLHYYKLAREAISLSIIEKGSLCYVQGLTIMADYLQKRNKPNAGFALIGVAWSMAMAIGLHREFDQDSTTPYTMEQRRRTWWTLYALVSSAQLTLGRPPASLVGINLRMPTNLDDASLAVDMTELPKPEEGPTTSTCIIEQIKLAQIGNAVQTELLTNQVPATHRVEALRRQLDAWSAELPTCFEERLSFPPWFELPKRILLWRAYHLHIVLNRPFLFRAISEKKDLTNCEGSVSECIRIADTCIVAICDFLKRGPDWRRGFAWYATYWLISASFVQATCFAYTSAGPRKEQWRLQLHQAVEALRLLKSVHHLAHRAQQMLERLLASSDQAADTETPGHITEAWNGAGEPSLVNFSVNYLGFTNFDELTQPTGENFVPAGDVYTYPWFQDEAHNAELMDAAGGITLQNYPYAW